VQRLRRGRGLASTAVVLGLLFGTGVVVPAIGGGIAGAASKQSTTNPACTPIPVKQHQTLTLAWAGAFEVWAPVIMAQSQGLFAKENLTVSPEVVSGSNALLLMEKGQLDLTLGGITGGMLNGIASGDTYRIVAPGVFLTPKSNGFYVDSKYLSKGKLNTSTFKGSTVAISVGGTSSSIAPGLNSYLEKQGLALSDLNVTQGISTTNFIALKTGAISGGYLNPPESVEFTQENLGKQVWTFAPKTPYAAYLASGADLKSKQPALRAFFRALQCSTSKYLQGNYHTRPAVVQAIATASGAPVSTINDGPAQYAWPVTLKFNSAGLVGLQKGWAGFGGILTYTKPLTVKQMVNQSVIPNIS
jgi:ABC-type nitrate/sulfonate/bicarbonate transport system substrate-binding protein